jgi:hypothetical protein
MGAPGGIRAAKGGGDDVSIEDEVIRKLTDAVLDHGRITWSTEEEAMVVTVDEEAVREAVAEALREPEGET